MELFNKSRDRTKNFHGIIMGNSWDLPDITRPWHAGKSPMHLVRNYFWFPKVSAYLMGMSCSAHRVNCLPGRRTTSWALDIPHLLYAHLSWLSCPSWLCRTTRDSTICNIPFSQVVENQQGNTRVDSGCSSTQCVHHPETMDILFLAAAYKKQCERKSPESDWELVGFWRPIRIIKNAIQIVKSWNSDFQISSKRLRELPSSEQGSASR